MLARRDIVWADLGPPAGRRPVCILLDRVEAGEQITITVEGQSAAFLSPMDRRRWMTRNEFAARVTGAQADPGLAGELRELAGEMPDN